MPTIMQQMTKTYRQSMNLISRLSASISPVSHAKIIMGMSSMWYVAVDVK